MDLSSSSLMPRIPSEMSGGSDYRTNPLRNGRQACTPKRSGNSIAAGSGLTARYSAVTKPDLFRKSRRTILGRHQAGSAASWIAAARAKLFAGVFSILARVDCRAARQNSGSRRLPPGATPPPIRFYRVQVFRPRGLCRRLPAPSPAIQTRWRSLQSRRSASGIDAVRSGNGLHQCMVAHRLVEINGRAARRVKPSKPHGTNKHQPERVVRVFEHLVERLVTHPFPVWHNVDAQRLHLFDLVCPGETTTAMSVVCITFSRSLSSLYCSSGSKKPQLFFDPLPLSFQCFWTFSCMR